MLKKMFFHLLLILLLLPCTSFITFPSIQENCDGCKRVAVLKKAVNLDKHHFNFILAEHATSPCFHLLYIGEIKELGAPFKWSFSKRATEYYFKASYENNMKGKIKSRLSISLYFEDGELIHNWKTESELPTVPYSGHLNRMFRNDTALFRKFVPLNVTLLNDFEKQPSQCNIHPEKEELFPGQETKVKISNMVDFEGRKSREFNRMVVQAINGKIEGGTPLSADPDLKAFQVGNGDITFTYVAPDDEDSQADEDKIIVFNSCDILKKDEFPMEKTGVKDKIAEKKIELVHADAMMTITQKIIQKLGSAEISWDATENAVLKYKESLSDKDEGTFTEYYDVKSWNLTDASATEIDYENNIKQETNQVEKDNYETPPSLSITFDSETGKAKEIEVPVFSFWFLFHDEINSRLPGETFGFFTDLKGGDGIHTMKGGGTQTINSVTYEENWNIKRYLKK